MKLTFWILVFPDILKPIGGVKQLHRLCEILISLGHDSFLVQEDASFHPRWFSSSVPTISKSDWFKLDLSSSSNYIILAETFVSAINLFKPGIRKIIFNQNSSYTFGLPASPFEPSNVLTSYSSNDVCAVWCISDYDLNYIETCLSLPKAKISKLINPVDLDSYLEGKHAVKKKQISFMSRKNKRDSEVVIALLKRFYPEWQFVEIANCNHHQVIKILSGSIAFLSFGHPEGFGLPVAEALACACYVIGYSGLGGRELFSLGSASSCSVEVTFGDLPRFIQAFHTLDEICSKDINALLQSLSSNSQEVRKLYSLNNFENSVAKAIASLRD